MFENKVVWITGASSGIGKAFAEAFHAQGARVILSALTADELSPVVGQLPGATPLAFDVTDFDQLPAIYAQALDAHGQIDILINNAGITQRALASDTSFDVYRKIIDIDLMAPIALTQLVTPHMTERGDGRIIVTGSVAGKFGSPLRTAYCSAKHGIFGYFDSLRTEINHLGVSVHVVAPGAVRTDLARNALTGEGDKFGKTDAFIEGGYTPEFLVSEALKGVQKGKYEILIARGPEYKGYLMRRFFPEASFKQILKLAPTFIKQFQASR